MGEFIKKQSVATYIAAVAGILTLVAMIISCVSSGVRGYAIGSLALVIIFSILAIALVALAIFSANKNMSPLISYGCMLVATVLCGICFILVAYVRAELVGTLWVTALDSTNPLAVQAMNTGTAACVMYLVSMIGLIVGGFLKFVKPAEKAAE